MPLPEGDNVLRLSAQNARVAVMANLLASLVDGFQVFNFGPLPGPLGRLFTSFPASPQKPKDRPGQEMK